MNQRPSQLTRFRVMAAMALAVLAIYLVVLFNTQVVHHEEYLAKSIQTITRMENVEGRPRRSHAGERRPEQRPRPARPKCTESI